MEYNSELQKKPKLFFSLMLFSVLMFCVSVCFDIPVARQVMGFVFLTIIPGLIVVQLLGMLHLTKLELLLVSVGLSIAFLSLSGLLINELFPLFGISQPLQFVPLFVCLIGFTLFGSILIYLKKDNVSFVSFELSKRDFLMVIPFVLIVLSAIGTFYMNVYGNNLLLLFMLVLIPLILIIAVVTKEPISSKYYAILVFVIALSLLVSSTFISSNLISYGSDSHLEFFVFKTAFNNQYWEANPYGDILVGRFDSMLSITILPTFYANILNLDATLLFKTIYPIIFAFVALCMFQVWQQFIGRKYALIATFLFVAEITFHTEMLGLNRQIVAELFFALLLWVVSTKKLKQFSKTVLFTIFSIGLVTSHYGLSLIFLGFICGAFIISYFTKRVNKSLTLLEITLFAVIVFSWYVFTSNSAVLDSISSFGEYVLARASDLFDLGARDETVLMGLGLSVSPTIWNTISRMFAYATEFLIILGFIGLLTRKLKNPFRGDSFRFIFIAILFLGALVVVPGLSSTMNITRFYHVTLFFLAPLFVLGAVFLAKLVYKRKKQLITLMLVLMIVIPYFMFQTGFMYEVTASGSYSISLSKNRLSVSQLYDEYGYVDSGSIAGAEWLSRYVDQEKFLICADDDVSHGVLWSYGLIYNGYVTSLRNTTLLNPNAIIYLGALNTETQTIYSWGGSSNLTQFVFFNLTDLSKVYDNGYSEMYRNNP
ncbi:MAG: DUF2206 domain-containing protein [Candidatus Bathyarchaeota archaeon]|nr:DUF2206 domain-containing protein [Candidatus Bathyarchaeum sp.]